MFKLIRQRCVVPRIVKNPRAFSRWLKIKWITRVRTTEKELGGLIECC